MSATLLGKLTFAWSIINTFHYSFALAHATSTTPYAASVTLPPSSISLHPSPEGRLTMQFQHEPLDVIRSIRVFVLYPGNFDDGLAGSLFHCQFPHDAPPTYSFLSYAWRDASEADATLPVAKSDKGRDCRNNLCTIRINDQPFRIGHNLALALLHSIAESLLGEKAYWSRIWAPHDLYHAQNVLFVCGTNGITTRGYISGYVHYVRYTAYVIGSRRLEQATTSYNGLSFADQTRGWVIREGTENPKRSFTRACDIAAQRNKLPAMKIDELVQFVGTNGNVGFASLDAGITVGDRIIAFQDCHVGFVARSLPGSTCLQIISIADVETAPSIIQYVNEEGHHTHTVYNPMEDPECEKVHVVMDFRTLQQLAANVKF
ncbi:hypothetical protein LZ31DRAFT_621093 [Colletotrichum somersetense]|nr:hypothetical protein LZ31DRAFT_621093 [Colletotrichum somersetense]